jgi:hypothetical protein
LKLGSTTPDRLRLRLRNERLRVVRPILVRGDRVGADGLQRLSERAAGLETIGRVFLETAIDDRRQRHRYVGCGIAQPWRRLRHV